MPRRRHSLLRTATLVGPLSLFALALGPGVVRAHDVAGSRFDAPIPLSLLFAGAAATVALTALWLAVTDRQSTTGAPRPVLTLDARAVEWVQTAARALFLLGVVAALVVGTVGRQVAAENIATVFTWPVWFRGLALLSILAGSPWRVLSPWRTLYALLCRLEGDQLSFVDYPRGLGSWPALLGFVLLVGVVENLTVVPRSPRLTATVVAVYALTMVGGAVTFGPVWFERADPLEALYGLFGRVSALSVDRVGTRIELSVRSPWHGCLPPVSGFPTVAFVVAAVYTVSFDGFTDTTLYQTLLFAVRDAVGTGPSTGVLLYVTGLALFVGAFSMATLAGDVLGASETRRDAVADGGAGTDWQGAARAFAPTVLPIAAAYDVAHNYPYVVRSTARLVELTVSPLFSPGSLEPLGWLSLPAFWGSQVLLVVVGHVFAVVAAHRIAVSRYPTQSSARLGHLPLLALMVGYTVLSLWVISQPVVA